MSNFFVVTLLLSFVGLVVGLIKPSLFVRIKIPTRKLVGLVFGGLFLISLIGIGITAEPVEQQTSISSPIPTTAKPKPTTTIQAQKPTVTPQTQEIIFDIPKLFGKPLPQLKSMIGQPTREKPNVYDTGGWAEWDRGDVTLSVNYNEKGNLIDTDIGCAMGILPSKLNVYWDEQKLRQAGNISGSAYPFRIAPRKNKDGVLYFMDICYK